MPEILFFSEEVDHSIGNESHRKAWLYEVIKLEKRKLGTINIILCSDPYLLKINQDHLNHDFYTDIITFDYSEGDLTLSGDLFISIDRVLENAKEYGADTETELDRVIVHGVLHLIGYNDKTPQEIQQMREKEEGYLSLRLY